MQRTISLAAAKSSSSTSVLSLRPIMAKLQCDKNWKFKYKQKAKRRDKERKDVMSPSFSNREYGNVGDRFIWNGMMIDTSHSDNQEMRSSAARLLLPQTLSIEHREP